MHMQGEPRTMQAAPHYDDVVAEVRDFLRERVAPASRPALTAERLVIDPGFGFGKTLRAQSAAAARRCGGFVALGLPVLVGLSRKSLLGSVTGRPVEQRLAGSVALATIGGACAGRAYRARARCRGDGGCCESGAGRARRVRDT